MKIARATLSAVILFGIPGLALAGSGPLTDAQIQQKLQADGYTNVLIKDHDKSHVDVTATKNGKIEKLAVNPQSGEVTPDEDKD